MKKWKKFIAMGLAVSMIVPSCIPMTDDGEYLLADGIDAETGEKRDGFYIYRCTRIVRPSR